MSFWRTEAGQQHRDELRRISAARLLVGYEPRGKKAQQQEVFFRDLLLEDAKIWSQTPLGGWPRPKADVALDISAQSSRNNAPRPDSLCKWLLDQLDGSRGTPVLFSDDRQVTMLFARCDRNETEPPSISVVARRAYLVRESLRRVVRDDENPWSPTDEASNPYPLLIGDDFGDSWLETCRGQVEIWEHLAEFQDVACEVERARLNVRIQTQRVRLALTDTMVARVIADHALPPLGVPPHPVHDPSFVSTYDALDQLQRMPYSYDLGVMTVGRGSKESFETQVRTILHTAVENGTTVYPLLNTVGVTVFYVPDPDGKDLDNIFRELLPIVLEVLNPPRAEPNLRDETDLWTSVAAGDRKCPGDPTVSFIEAVALKGVDLARHPPGTIYMSLGPGDRRESWWGIAIESRR